MTTKSIANRSKYSTLLGRGLEACRSLGMSHDDAERGSRYLRDFNRESLVHIVGTVGNKHANYRAYDVATGLILAALTSDAGAHNREIIREASLACYAWTKFTAPNDPPFSSPVIAALEGTERGELWVLRVDIRKSDQTGKNTVRAVLYDGERGLPGNDFPADYLPHVTMMVHLGPLLMPIVGAVNGRLGKN